METFQKILAASEEKNDYLFTVNILDKIFLLESKTEQAKSSFLYYNITKGEHCRCNDLSQKPLIVDNKIINRDKILQCLQ